MDDFPNIDLSVLTARQRMVVVLRYFDNWTIADIAEGLRTTNNAVKQTHTRAIRRLRERTAYQTCSYRVDDE